MTLEELITLTAASLLNRTQGKTELAIRLAIRLHNEVCEALAPLQRAKPQKTTEPIKLPGRGQNLPDPLSERQAVAYLGIRLDEIRHAVNTGALQPVTPAENHKRRFAKTDLDRYRFYLDTPGRNP